MTPPRGPDAEDPMPPDDLLTTAPRCLFAYAGPRWPVVSPMAFWSDGAALWMTTSGAAAKTDALRRDPRCAVYVPPDPVEEGAGATPGAGGGPADGLRIDGRVRVFGPHDPVGLVLHGPTLSAAVAALSVKQAGAVAGYARDVVRVPPRWLPAGRVVLKVVVDRLRRTHPPGAGGGIAPPLPPVVPAAVRRAVGGRRDAVLATTGGGRLEIGPVRLGTGFRITSGPAWEPPPGPAALVVQADDTDRPTRTVGLRLSGELGADGALTPQRATWWQGFAIGSADVPARPRGVVLPD